MSENRRTFIKSGVGASIAAMAGCLSNGEGNGEGTGNVRPMEIESWPPEDPEDQVYAWSWYNDWNDWLAEQFSNEFDIQATSEAYGGPSDWLAELRAGDHNVDNASTTAQWLGNAVNEDLVDPLPVNQMPCWDRVRPELKADVEEHLSAEGGGVYGIPHQISINPCLVYNTNYFDEPPNSWSVLWDEAHEGEMALFTSHSLHPTYTAAFHLGQDPMDPDDTEEIKEALIQQKPLNITYQDDHESMMQMYVDETVKVGNYNDGRVMRAVFDHDAPIDIVIPEGGALYSTDLMFLPKNSPNPKASLKYINYMLGEDEPQRKFIELSRYRPALTNEAITELTNDEPNELVNRMTLSEEDLGNLEFSRPLDQELIEEYDQIWTEVQAA